MVQFQACAFAVGLPGLTNFLDGLESIGMIGLYGHAALDCAGSKLTNESEHDDTIRQVVASKRDIVP